MGGAGGIGGIGGMDSTEDPGALTVRLSVNGSAEQVSAPPDTPLLQVLRGVLQLRGSRLGCGVGQCGACFVLVEGVPVPSCTTPLWSVEGRSVVTVEGLARDGALHPVQQAFLDEQAGQCGFCLSGVLVSAAALLAREASPTRESAAAALERHLCRCAVQGRMVSAVVRAGQAGAGDHAPR